MNASPAPDGELKFDSPPVQQVVLGIYFAPVLPLGALQLMPIIEAWRIEYPVVDEFPHVHSWRPVTEEEMDRQRPGRNVSPFFTMSSEDAQRSLQFQQDRLLLIWRFEAEGSAKEYVGYEALKEELKIRFEQFAASIIDTAQTEVVPERCDATYQNLIDMSPRDFTVGVLTNWAAGPATLEAPSLYSGVRLGDLDVGDDQIDSLVSIENGPDGFGTDFTIDIERKVSGDESYLAALDAAHQAVLRIFTQMSSEALMSAWGRK